MENLTAELTAIAKDCFKILEINAALEKLALKYERDLYEISEEYNYICDCLAV